MVEPAKKTGSKIASGVSTPVLPTFISILSSLVNFFSAGYLYAVAHFGDLAVEPSISLCLKLLVFITAPSMSYSRLARF